MRIVVSIVFVSIYIFSFILLNVQCQKEKKVFNRNVIWRANELDVKGYRIPGVVVTKNGVILVFSEQRPEFGDANPKSIVMKRSFDNGDSWSENIYIETSDGTYWNNHPELMDPNDISEKKEVWTNPAPIVDNVTGRVFIFYALSEGEVAGENLQRFTYVYYKYSDDDGLTWSKRENVTDLLNANQKGNSNVDYTGSWITDQNGFPCDYLGRAFHMPGPGHGIQLSSGRLLLQVWNRTGLKLLNGNEIPVKDRNYGLCTIYSDDHGESWNYGSSFGHVKLNMNESRMVELDNGNVYINARYVNDHSISNKCNYRITAISADGGISWSEIQINRQFKCTNPCDGSIIKVKDGNMSKLLYCKNESTIGRKNLVVRTSINNGQNWDLKKVIDPEIAWYNDMAVLPNNNIFLVYETGANCPVYCVRFNLNWLLND